MFVWNEGDIIDCLGVVPEIDEYETRHRFLVTDNGLTLELSLCQYDGDIDVRIYQDGLEPAVVEFGIVGSDAMRRVHSADEDYLEIGAATLFGGRYDGDGPIPYGVRVYTKPSIRVAFFRARM